MTLFIQKSYGNTYNIFPDDIDALQWLYIQVSKHASYTIISSIYGEWVGVSVNTTDPDVLDKIKGLYETEKAKDIPAWSPQSREANMKLSSEYRDFVRRQGGE